MTDKTRFAIYTELLGDDADAARLAERVEECVVDHEGASVKWLQTVASENGHARLTAVVKWVEAGR